MAVEKPVYVYKGGALRLYGQITDDDRAKLDNIDVAELCSGFTIASGTSATANSQQPWDDDGEYLYHIDTAVTGISANTYIQNPVFNTGALDILAPYLETGSGYIRLYLNEATTSVAITLSSYVKQEL